MKTRENKKMFLYFVRAIPVAIIIVYIVALIYGEEYFDSVNTILSFSFNILSLFISVIALFISIFTYSSIDSVNMISSMEGNVLCNENYNAEYAILVDNYSECTDAKELEEKLYQTISKNLKEKSGTCMQFTDRIQEILDSILWYAYVDTKSDHYKEHINEIIKSLDDSYKKFNSISNGNQYILSEHIKLIKNVLKYQEVTHAGGKPDTSSEMLNIRGRMFQNAVSKTIYYDYLGLEYHKKAVALLRSIIGFEGTEFMQENMEKISAENYSEEVKRELFLYLSKAHEAFEKAMESASEDILWKGYITFNKARIDLICSVILNKFDDNWDKSIREAIYARYGVVKIFAPKGEKSFLHKEFEKEYYYSKALYLSMQTYRKTNDAFVKSEAENILKSIPEHSDKNCEVFDRTKIYIEDILKTIESRNA